MHINFELERISDAVLLKWNSEAYGGTVEVTVPETQLVPTGRFARTDEPDIFVDVYLAIESGQVQNTAVLRTNRKAVYAVLPDAADFRGAYLV